MERSNRVVAQGARVRRVVPIGREAIAVVPAQAVIRTEPHESMLVLQDDADVIVRKTICRGQRLKDELLSLSR